MLEMFDPRNAILYYYIENSEVQFLSKLACF